jgi:uncharacterized membrane protein
MPRVDTGRLEAFSDGVLAIIITIMVLDLRTPTGTDWHSLWHTTGSAILGYVLSFVYVGIYWNNHHHMLQLTDRVSGGVLWANLHLLFWLSLFPFSTRWIDGSGLAGTPVLVYGLNFLAAAIAYFVLQRTILGIQEPSGPLARAIGRDLKGKLSPLLYVCGCVAAGLSTHKGDAAVWIAIAFYVAVAVMWLVPDRRIERTLAS